jgi:hypothetical protein
MRLKACFYFSIWPERTRAGDNCVRGGMTVDDFVRKITDKLKKVDDDVRRKDELAVHRAKAIEAHAPNEWRALREWMKQFCEDANREMETGAFTLRQEDNNRELTVNAKVGAHSRIIQANFDSQTNVINYDSSRHAFKPHVDDAGNFTFMDGGMPITVKQMGEKMIRILTEA